MTSGNWKMSENQMSLVSNSGPDSGDSLMLCRAGGALEVRVDNDTDRIAAFASNMIIIGNFYG